MVSYNIDSIESAKNLVKICENYEEDIDVICGRQIIDGKSILGVISLIGRTVGLEIITNNFEIKERFRREF